MDNDAGGSDTNMLVRFDAENKKIDVVSLPRDTLMSNGRKLNSSYNNGGTEKLRSNIEDMLGIPVDFYVSVDLKGFIALIDRSAASTSTCPRIWTTTTPTKICTFTSRPVSST